MEVLCENKYIQLKLDDPHNCIEYQWKKHAPKKQFMNLMDRVCRFVNKYNCNKLLLDLWNQAKLTEEVRQWAEIDWFPRLVKQGVRIFAVVSSNSAPSRNITIKTKKTEIIITTRYFDDILKARSWISKL